MDVLIIIPFIYILCTMSISLHGYSDYIGREQTGAIKGLFAVVILYQHLRSYLPSDAFGTHCNIFNTSLNLCGQLMVVMFLFYSGYGIMCALQRDKAAYLNNFLSHRFLKVWLMFAIAVGLFLILDIALGHNYPLSTILLSFIGWESIGNSNWFMFDILALYLFTYLSCSVISYLNLDIKWSVCVVFALTILLILFLKYENKGFWWVDTVLAYPAGMFYGLKKEKFEKLVRGWRWLPVFISILATFIIGKAANSYGWLNSEIVVLRFLRFFTFIGLSSMFAFLIVMLTMKIKVTPPILKWLGVNAFSIYILQRAPMILFTHLGLNNDWTTFALAVIPVTLVVASLYTHFLSRLNKYLFPKKYAA